eukprot:5593174-Prorocentrum_lima.AAC.1
MGVALRHRHLHHRDPGILPRPGQGIHHHLRLSGMRGSKERQRVAWGTPWVNKPFGRVEHVLPQAVLRW